MTAEAPRATKLGLRHDLGCPVGQGVDSSICEGIFGLAPWDFMVMASLVTNSTVKKEDVEIHRRMANGQD